MKILFEHFKTKIRRRGTEADEGGRDYS